MATPSKPRLLKKLWALLTSPQRRTGVVILSLMLIGMVLETVGVGVVIPAIGLITQPDFIARYPGLQSVLASLGDPTHQQLVIGGMILLVAVYAIKAVFLAFLVWRQMRFAYDVQAGLSQRLFTVYLHQPYTFHLQRNSAQLIRNATTEVHMFTNLLIAAMNLLTEALVLAGLCTLLLVVEPVSALIVVTALGASTWAFHRRTRTRIADWGEARHVHEGMRIQHLQQGLGGAKDVKLLGREADFLGQFSLHNLKSARVGILQSTLVQLPRLWLELLSVTGLALLVITMLAQGRPLAAVLPAMGLFTAAAFRIIPSVNRVLAAVQALRYGAPVINMLHSELQLDVPGGESVGPTASFRNVLDVSQVSYTYPGAPAPALRDVSVSVRCGESVGFIGSSGAGKSTLVDVLLGLLTPDEGDVRVDGRSVQGQLRRWQDHIGYVPQSIFLTDDTLRRNVAFGIPDEQIDEAAVQRAIRAAQLDEFVATLPDGVETLVGERGIRLSGGQRQRIGIARALYHDPDVLVLDEATSALDTATERGVLEAIIALRGSKTILIVAHRFSTVEHCDRLYRLEHGRVVAEGQPSTMLHGQTAGHPLIPA